MVFDTADGVGIGVGTVVSVGLGIGVAVAVGMGVGVAVAAEIGAAVGAAVVVGMGVDTSVAIAVEVGVGKAAGSLALQASASPLMASTAGRSAAKPSRAFIQLTERRLRSRSFSIVADLFVEWGCGHT